MVSATYKKHGIRMIHVWFADTEEIRSCYNNTDMVFAHGIPFSPKDVLTLKLSTQQSLIKTLNSDPDIVYYTFGKHLRKFIQRSIGEGTTVRLLHGPEITDATLDTCMSLYNRMKEDKGLHGTFNTALAKEYAKTGNLLVSQACIGETVVGFKASIVDEHHLRGWVSAFAFREDEFDAQTVSRAHQLLEWETMQYCCRNGITSYDFGGIASFENPNGIDRFKMTFAKEGQRVSYDNYLVGVSLIGKAAIVGYKLAEIVRR